MSIFFGRISYLINPWMCDRFTGSLKYHRENLQRSCRICGEYSGSKTKQYFRECQKFANQILITFGVDVENDSQDICPTKMCNKCYIKCFKKEKNNNFKVPIDTCIWLPHQQDNCDICQTFQTFHNGGRKRKNTRSKGRPAKKLQITETLFDSLEKIQNAISSEIIPAAITNKMPALERFVLPPEELVCSVCKEVLDTPLQCPCEHHFCRDCITEWIYNTGNLSSCPLCKTPVSVETLSKVPRLVLNLLCSLLVSCSSCKTHVRLDCLDKHEESCKEYLAQPCTTMVSEVLKTPCSAPLSASEEILATHLMKRKIHNSTPSQIILKTGGTVSISHLFDLGIILFTYQRKSFLTNDINIFLRDN